MKYKPSDPFYHSAAWRRVRGIALTRDKGMCRDCMDAFEAGRIAHPHRATTVHHVIPRELRPDLALDLSNLRSVCEACHNKAHPEKGRQAEYTEPRRKMRVIKV